jgi:hypothetical protein
MPSSRPARALASLPCVFALALVSAAFAQSKPQAAVPPAREKAGVFHDCVEQPGRKPLRKSDGLHR